MKKAIAVAVFSIIAIPVSIVLTTLNAEQLFGDLNKKVIESRGRYRVFNQDGSMSNTYVEYYKNNKNNSCIAHITIMTVPVKDSDVTPVDRDYFIDVVSSSCK